MKRIILTGALLLLAGPCMAQEFDVDALFQKWLAEENRTLEGQVVLDDFELIEHLAPLRLGREELSDQDKERVCRANFLLAICYTHGTGGAPADWMQASAITARLRAMGYANWVYLAVREEILWHGTIHRLLEEGLLIESDLAAKFEELAETDFPAAKMLFGQSILNGGYWENGVRVEKAERGLEYIRNAAEAGCLPALVKAGTEYVRGITWKRDSGAGLALLEKAAAKDYAPALFELGRYFDPRGQQPDLLKARSYYERAAKLGDHRSMRRLAELPPKPVGLYTVSEFYAAYVRAWGTPEAVPSGLGKLLRSPPNSFLSRFDGAFDWLRLWLNEKDEGDVSAEHLKARAMFGECLLHGIGGAEADSELAMHWLTQARDNLAALLLRGEYQSNEGVVLGFEKIRKALEDDFAPAVRLEAWVVLSGKDAHYMRWRVFDDWKLPSKSEAVETLEEMANEGDLQAALLLSRHYEWSTSSDEWIEWGSRAAELGHAGSAIKVANEYLDERSDPYDLERARHLYEIALDDPQTHFTASEMIGYLDRLHLRERTQALLEDLETSLNRHGDLGPFLDSHEHIAGLVQRVALDGDASGEVLYGLCLVRGHGIYSDPELAEDYFLKHSESPIATYLQGWLYEVGWDGRPADAKAALWCYRSVADVGGAYASYRLGLINRDGEYGSVDAEEAFVRFGEAAEGGCLPAMVELAKAYREGSGVEADEAAALKWIKQAADEGYEDAEALLKEWEGE